MGKLKDYLPSRRGATPARVSYCDGSDTCSLTRRDWEKVTKGRRRNGGGGGRKGRSSERGVRRARELTKGERGENEGGGTAWKSPRRVITPRLLITLRALPTGLFSRPRPPHPPPRSPVPCASRRSSSFIAPLSL